MLTGVFQDRLCAPDGRTTHDTGWRPNMIANTAWPLVAGLLHNDETLTGLQFCAVGEGLAAWDTVPPSPEASRTDLVQEVDRGPVLASNLTYVDGNGRPTSLPTTRVEATVVFSWPTSRVLREFGLVGGNATRAAGTGYLVNYVVHPLIDVAPGQTLTRKVRLSFRPGAASGQIDWLELPPHWLGGSPVTMIDGVGMMGARSLGKADIRTILDLAVAEPTEHPGGLAVTKVLELRAKARLTLRTAGRLSAVPKLTDRTLHAILSSSPASLAAEVGLPGTTTERLREELSALQLALDERTIKALTLGQLLAPTAPGTRQGKAG